MQKAQKLGLVYGNVLIVGVDVAKKNHFARIHNQMGLDAVKPFRFHNNKEGFYRLLSRICEAQSKEGTGRVVVGMEPTGHYWKPLARFLHDHGYTVVIVNPYHVKKSKELEDNTQTKSDRKDAGIIVQLVKEGRFLNCILPTGVYAELRTLSATRGQQARKLNSALCQMRAILDEYFPELEQVFKDLLGKAAKWILRNRPFPEDILKVEAERLAEELKQASSHRVGMKRAEKLIAAAEESIGVKEGLQAARAKLMSCLDEIEFYHGQLKKTEDAMGRFLVQTGLGEYLLSIPGVGVVTAAGFLGEIGDPGRYSHWKQIQKLAGYNLVEQSSGQKRGQRSISKRGRPGLRSLLYRASMTLVAKNKEFRTLYHHFLTRPTNPLKKKQALVAIALKLLRVMFALIAGRKEYDPAKVLGEYREKQLSQAA